MTLEQRVSNLEQMFLQMQRNFSPIVSKTDENSNNIVSIAPYTDTKVAYIDDTELIFTNVPTGAWYVSFNNDATATRVTKDRETLIVEFDPMKEVTEVTVTVQ